LKSHGFDLGFLAYNPALEIIGILFSGPYLPPIQCPKLLYIVVLIVVM
jgi:hypothetical protein